MKDKRKEEEGRDFQSDDFSSQATITLSEHWFPRYDWPLAWWLETVN